LNKSSQRKSRDNHVRQSLNNGDDGAAVGSAVCATVTCSTRMCLLGGGFTVLLLFVNDAIYEQTHTQGYTYAIQKTKTMQIKRM
jgi:hypothetical protein